MEYHRRVANGRKILGVIKSLVNTSDLCLEYACTCINLRQLDNGMEEGGRI